MFQSDFVASICNAIDGVQRHRGCVLVALDGPGCSGKSTLAHALQAALGDAVVCIGTDEFFVPFAQQDLQCPPRAAVRDGVAHLRWRELRAAIDRLVRCRSACYRRYDWEADSLGEMIEVLPGPIVLIEGLYSLHEALRDAFAFKLWIDACVDDRMLRVKARDGQRLLDLWHRVYIPRESWYLRSQRPFEHADLFVLGAGLDWGATDRSFCRQHGYRYA